MSRLIQIAMYVLIFMLILSIITVALNGGNEKPGDTPVNTPDPNVTTPKPGNSSPQTYKQQLAERLRDANITVLSVKTKDGTATLRYVPAKTNKSAIVQEMGTIYLQYTSLIQSGWKINQLKAEVILPANQPTNNSSANKSRDAVAVWYLKTKWIKNTDGENISKKILQKIFNSIKLKSGNSPRIRPPVSSNIITLYHQTGFSQPVERGGSHNTRHRLLRGAQSSQYPPLVERGASALYGDVTPRRTSRSSDFTGFS